MNKDKNFKILVAVVVIALVAAVVAITHTHSQNQKTARVKACQQSHGAAASNPFKPASVPGTCDSNGNFHPTKVVPSKR